MRQEAQQLTIICLHISWSMYGEELLKQYDATCIRHSKVACYYELLRHLSCPSFVKLFHQPEPQLHHLYHLPV